MPFGIKCLTKPIPFIAIIRGDRLCFLEVKTHKGVLSDPQKAFGVALDAHGVPWMIVRSIDDARRALSLFGIQTREAA